MPLVHIAVRRLAPRALGAARLLAGATTESEMDAAQRLVDTLAARGVVAERVMIPGPPDMRMSNDGMLMVGPNIFHPSLLLVCLLQSIGFIASMVTAFEAPHVISAFFWMVTAVLLVIAIRARRTIHRWWDQERDRVALEEAEAVIAKDKKGPTS